MATAVGAIVAVNPAATVTQPTANVFNYAYCNNSKAYLGTLNGILNEPVFVGKINSGAAALTLDIDHYPTELTFGNLIRVTYPTGQVAGYWRYEGRKSVMAGQNKYTLTLTPLSAELKEISFNANYSSDTTQPNTALGAATFDTPVKAAIAKTVHLSAGTILNDGTSYAYVFNNCTGQDTLNQAMTFAGSTWWWYVDANGVVSLANASPFVHTWTVGTEVSAGEWDDDILSLWNGQPVIGGTGPEGTASLTALAVDTNPANPYSTVNIGERTAAPYQDSSLVTQASVNAVATSLLGYAERVTSTRKLTLTHYTTRRPQPGDACYLVETDPASGDPTSKGNLVKQGPYLITDVTEYGGTFRYQVTVSASMTVPVLAFNPQLSQEQALLKLMQQPQIQPVSNDGKVGSIGNGVLGGAASGGALNATPGQPIGLTASTGIDNLAQTNNAYIQVSWSAPSASDNVSLWPVQWRKATDPDVAASYYRTVVNGSLGLKIPGLIQGTSYVVMVAAINGAGVQSAWSTLSETTALDTTAPAVPANLVAYRTPRGAMVSWAPGAESAGGSAPDLQGFWLQVAIDGISQGWQDVTPGSAGAYSLNTSTDYTAPTGTPQGTVLYFRVAAVDWSGNVSAFTTQTPAIYTDGVSFEELTVGQLNAYGLLTATGGITTRATVQQGQAASGPGVDINASGITLYDGTATDHGAGAGITGQLNATNGNAFFSGTVSASQILGVAGGAGGSGARMWIDLADTSAGVGPLIDVNDGTYDRVQIGNLSANGNSPAQYGIRAIDNQGHVIFDSLGISQAASVLGTSNGSSTINFSGTLSGLSGTNTSFVVSNRPQNILVLGIATIGGVTPAGNLINPQASVGVNGQGYGQLQSLYNTVVQGTVGTDSTIQVPITSWYYQSGIPVGSYNAQFQGVLGGSALAGGIFNWQIIVIQLGG